MLSADQILDALDPEQREVALTTTGPVCVLAGAGTGKTRAITHRIAYGVRTGTFAPTSVLAVTFTARAAGEMRTRLRQLGVEGVQARTFHSAALRQLGFFWPKVVGGTPPQLMEHKASAVAEAAQRLSLEVDRLAVRDLAGEVEWAKVSLVEPDDYVRAATSTRRPEVAGYSHQTVARLLVEYEKVKSTRSVIDFEDVLLLLAAMLHDHRDVAEQVRSQYRRFVVDEFQDVSPLQKFLLDQWLGGRKELCVVGDPAQTIYSFTGATPHHLLHFTREYPSAKVVKLVRDYRSTPQVVGLANQVLATRGRRSESLELIAQRPAGPPVSYTAYPDDDGEAEGIAQRVARLVEAGTPASEIAVLYRTNAQSEAFEQALSSAGIGYIVRGGEQFFRRRDVREGIAVLRAAVRQADPDEAMPEQVRDALRDVGWAETPPSARGAVRERWDAMAALVSLADDLTAELATSGRDATLSDLVTELDERAAAQHAPIVDGVTLATLHAAKGLEWDAVFLAGLSEGLMPISLAETDAAVAEERRLLYVGVTRAREHLELSYSRARNPGGRAGRKRTRFLDGIWPDDQARRRVAGQPGPGRAKEGTPRVKLTGEYDGELFEALREWRASVATVTGRPAYTVVHDSTLEAVAELRPTSVEELGRVGGFGPVRIESYGKAVLAIVRESTSAPDRENSSR